MSLFKQTYRVESTRLPGHDYAQPGWYFVTLCTRGQECVLGRILDGVMHHSEIGDLVVEEWLRTPHVRAGMSLDEWVVMPNHLHGIIVIEGTGAVAGREINRASGANRGSAETPRRGISTRQGNSTLRAGSLGAIIGQFKSVSTKRICALGYHRFAWQPRFYDHVVRDDSSLARIRQYILDNPARWEDERERVANLWM